MSLPDTDLAPFAFDGMPPALAPAEKEDDARTDEGTVSSLPTGAVDAPPGSRAVIYLRVSSKGAGEHRLRP